MKVRVERAMDEGPRGPDNPADAPPSEEVARRRRNPRACAQLPHSTLALDWPRPKAYVLGGKVPLESGGHEEI